jgi:hypothetical protein
MEPIGVTENAAWVTNDAEARSIVDLARTIGFNAFKIIVPWTSGQAEVVNDQVRTCNVARAARADGMSFYLDIEPQTKDGRPGGMPVRLGDVRRYATTAVAYLSALAGPDGCTPGSPVTIEIGNEPNNNAFWALSDPALAYTRLLAFTDAALKDAARTLGVDVTVVGGELTFTRDPLGFVQKMGDAERRLGIRQPIMDVLGVHPYDNGTITINEQDNMLLPAVGRSLGPVEIQDTEYASAPPTDRQEASAYSYAINAAACQGILTFFTFKLFDDPGSVKNGWASGLFEPLPRASTAWPPSPEWAPVSKAIVLERVKTVIGDALSGRLTCPPQHR